MWSHFEFVKFSETFQLDKLQVEGHIGSYSVLTIRISEGDLDEQFSSTLQTINLDLRGKLVDNITLSGTLIYMSVYV